MFRPDYQSRIIDRLFDSPDLYVPMIDEEKEAALVVPMTRDTYSRSTFLDWRTERAGEEAELVPIRSLEQAYIARNIRRRPLRFIFHPAFAGSTLLCRCLDRPGICLPYKEPWTLLQISTSRREGPHSEQSRDGPMSLGLALALLARSYGPAEKVVIEPWDGCINIAEDLMSTHPGSMAVMLSLPLEDYVLSNLKRKGRRIFLRNNIPRAKVDLNAMGLLNGVDPYQLTDGETVAYVWYWLMAYYVDILRNSTLNIRTLDSPTFYRRPQKSLRALVDFFNVSFTDEQIDDAVRANVFSRDSKDPSKRYDAESKAVEDSRLRVQLKQQIDEALAWLDDNTSEFPIPAKFPRPLIDAA